MSAPASGAAMDFFEAQARARRRTVRLVWLFGFAVLGTILACYAAAFLIFSQISEAPSGRHDRGRVRVERSLSRAAERWWDPTLFAGVSGTVLLIVGGASLMKWNQLRAGGRAVAEMVGGRRVAPATQDPGERRLLNVVEEMAIAAGMPVPAVYVLPEESAINAFAAGLTTRDAVVAVTRGALAKLSRDELQGVVGHEFSHILNGDMRLNVRLMAILFGILALGLIGRGILYGLARSRVRLGNNRKSGGAVALIALIGLALFVIGMVGYFFGRLIQSAVSRQREYLADAAAVQFTRNPTGLAGALRKIGGEARGAQLSSEKAAEIGHFFFAEGVGSWFGGLFATHPPLELRIRAVEPSWDGRYAAPSGLEDILDGRFGASSAAGLSTAASFAATPGAESSSAAAPHALLARVPALVLEAARQPASAPSLVYALLLSRQPGPREAQLRTLRERAPARAAETEAALEPAVAALSSAARLALVQLAAPALRELPRDEAEALPGVLNFMIQADANVSLFELALERVVAHQLEAARGRGAPEVSFRRPGEVEGDISCVLGRLALADEAAGGAAAAAFARGAAVIASADGSALRVPTAGAVRSMDTLGVALDRLSKASLPVKKRVLEAAAAVVRHDGRVGSEEAELYRVLAAVLDCPAPLLSDGAAHG